MAANVLEVDQLQTYFYTRGGVVKAVDGVSFSVPKGKTLGIVGESGSGKSVTMMSILGLIPQPPGRIVGGSAKFHGEDLIGMDSEKLRSIRGQHIAMIFQDPMTSLNPYLRISTQLTEALTEHGLAASDEDARAQAIDALKQVGIPEAEERIDQYPHQFSGGMRQRVMIAMALITKPDLLIADEPTTALDVTIQAQILTLLRDLQKDVGLSVILITHDLGVVASMSDDVLVMYAGQAAEFGSVEDIFYRNHHPYTSGLLKSIPTVENGTRQVYSIDGLPPDPSRLPPGCPFAPRCNRALAACREDIAIPARKIASGHLANCHLEVRA